MSTKFWLSRAGEHFRLIDSTEEKLCDDEIKHIVKKLSDSLTHSNIIAITENVGGSIGEIKKLFIVDHTRKNDSND